MSMHFFSRCNDWRKSKLRVVFNVYLCEFPLPGLSFLIFDEMPAEFHAVNNLCRIIALFFASLGCSFRKVLPENLLKFCLWLKVSHWGAIISTMLPPMAVGLSRPMDHKFVLQFCQPQVCRWY